MIAIEVRAVNPAAEWPEPLTQAWGAAMGDVATWATAAEAAGADVVVLQLTMTDSAGQKMNASRLARRCAPCWAPPACR